MDGPAQLDGLSKRPRRVMSDPLQAFGNVRVFLPLDGVFFHRFQPASFFGVVQDPGLNAFQHVDHCFVVVQAVHADQSVAVGLAGHLRFLVFRHLDQPVEAVLERVVVVDDLAALGQGVPGIEHADHRLHDRFFDVVPRYHLLVLVAQVIHGLADPGLGHLQHGRRFLLAYAELASNGDDVPKAVGHVAAACPELRHLVGAGAALVQGSLVKLVLSGHVIALG